MATISLQVQLPKPKTAGGSEHDIRGKEFLSSPSPLYNIPRVTPRILVANTGPKSKITDVQVCSSRTVQKVADVQGFYFVSKGIPWHSEVHNEKEDVDRERGFSKAMRSATKTQQFLHPGKSNGQGATAMLVGSSGFVEEIGSRADPDRFNFTTFHETNFVFPGKNDSDSSYLSTDFWSVRSSNLKTMDGLLTPADGPNFDSIEIFSGLCLWSMNVLVGSSGEVSNPCDLLARMCWSSENAEAILNRLEHSPPTLYEVEGICRLSSAIADMAGTIHHRVHTSDSCGTPIRITLDLPGMQYYYMAIQSRKSGFWTSRQGQRYADIVQQRRSRISNVFRQTIALELSARGISSIDAANISIAIATGTEAAESELRCMLDEESQDHLATGVERVISALRCNDKSGLWAEYLDLLGPTATPSAPQELAAASYVFQVLKPILQKIQKKSKGDEQTTLTRERVLMIEVDSAAEWRIYARADQLLKKLHKQQLKQDGIDAVLFGVFPVERILTSQTTGRANLYLHDPGQRMWERNNLGDELSPLSAAQKVFRQETVEALKEFFCLESFPGLQIRTKQFDRLSTYSS